MAVIRSRWKQKCSGDGKVRDDRSNRTHNKTLGRHLADNGHHNAGANCYVFGSSHGPRCVFLQQRGSGHGLVVG